MRVCATSAVDKMCDNLDRPMFGKQEETTERVREVLCAESVALKKKEEERSRKRRAGMNGEGVVVGRKRKKIEANTS